MTQPSRGSLDGSRLRIGLVVSRFNAPVVEALLASARAGLSECGVPDDAVHSVSVPGAVEIPLAAKMLGDTHQLDAIVALGAVIRGETTHYEEVCRMAADGCMRVQLDLELPVAFGVLTVENGEQAMARQDKGRECVHVAIEMANLLRGQEA